MLAATAAGSASCGSAAPPATPGLVRVVAAENVWGDVVKQVGGRHVSVTSLISNPNTDPHLFETDPRTAASLAAAQLVVENGLGYDDFVGKALAAAGGSRRVLDVAHVLGMTTAANPHLWYWTARLPAVADAIARELTAIDPRDRSEFETGAARLVASLKPLLATISAIKHRYAGTKIGYTERVPGYLVGAAGLVLGTPPSFAQAIEDGNDPSPQDVATFDTALSTHRVKVLLYNSQVVDAQSAHIKQLAVRVHVPVVGMSEMLPPGFATFQAWQLRQDRELLAALGG